MPTLPHILLRVINYAGKLRGEIAATIWRQPQFLPNLLHICSPASRLWIPSNACKVSIPAFWHRVTAICACCWVRGGFLCVRFLALMSQSCTPLPPFFGAGWKRVSAVAEHLSAGLEPRKPDLSVVSHPWLGIDAGFTFFFVKMSEAGI